MAVIVDRSTNARATYLVDPATGDPPASTGGLTDTELRATPVPVSGTVNLGTIGGAATSAKQDTQITAEQAILAKIIAAPATEAKQDTAATLTGSVTETAPASDTASSGLNGRLQRIAQRITSLIALVPASLGSKAAASSFAVTQSTEDAAQLGSLTETAPASDTASSGLNGRLQRIAQRLTSLIALLPASLGAKAANASLSVSNSFLTAAALGDGSVNTAESITVANTVQVVEFFNLSANVIWASWTGTAAASTTGSFPIPALASGVAGYYSSPPGASGTLSIIAVGGASAFTCIGWS